MLKHSHSLDILLMLFFFRSIAAFWLCRYGDEFDIDADIKAFNEMIRVLNLEVI